ncbi:hypothetical protein [Mycolicibacterium sp. XJ1819]
MQNVLPAQYPIVGVQVEQLIEQEHRLGHLLDFGLLAARVDALYASAARDLQEPRLLERPSGWHR